MSANSFPEFIRSLMEHGLEFFGVYYGTYRAVVVDNNDPTKQGKLKIRCDIVHGDATCEVWAWPVSPWASSDCGMWVIPDKGDSIYVMFDHGRADAPLWFGGWWGSNEPTEDMTLKKVVLATKEGMKVVLDRENQTVLVEQSIGNSVFISDEVMELKHAGKILVEGEDISVHSMGTTEVTAMGSCRLEAMDEVSITSTGKLKIDGADSVDIGSTSAVRIHSAGMVDVTSDGPVSLTSLTSIGMIAPLISLTGAVTVAGAVGATGNFMLTGNFTQIGNGNVTGNWYATNNSAHHTHPVVLGVAIRSEP